MPHSRTRGPSSRDDRPFAFLVSSPHGADDLARSMGLAAYSYGFVLKALAPLLETLGEWTPVTHPESRLVLLAERARAEGKRPVHLALQPPQAVYQTPGVPTVLFPFWEFPDLPDRDFHFDTRQTWRRSCRTLDLILSACRFTERAFREGGVSCPIEVVPVPIEPEAFDLEPWDPDRSTEIDCRHFVWGGDEPPPPGGPPPRAPRGLKAVYHHRVKPWLSPHAIQTLRETKRKLLRRPVPMMPLLPRSPLRLSGLVLTSLFNYSDNRKNPGDLLTAFLSAFRNRPDVTLVFKMATSPTREFLELQELRAEYARIGIRHRCRVAVVTDFLDDDQMAHLYRATTYYVNTSHAEGACLPLMRALAGGRPAIAPAHTSLADYVDDRVGFVVESYPEPAYWPHDPEKRMESRWHRLVWSDLRDGFLHGAALAENDRRGYDALSEAARERMAGYASRPAVLSALKRALARLPERPVGAHSWAS